MVANEVCLLCGARLTRPSTPLPVGRVIGGGEILVCVGCGSGQVMPISARAGLGEAYDQEYYEASGMGSLTGGVDEASPILKERLAWLQRRFGKPARLLDLGCATGVFVAYARDRGWRAVGVEQSAWAADEGRRVRRVEILTGTLESVELEPGSFDVVHANHVIEHLEDPVATLRKAADLLAPGGLLLAAVPYELSLPLAEAAMTWLGRPPSRPDSTYHLSFFSRSGLIEASRRAGMRVESVRAVQRTSPEPRRGVRAVKLLGVELLYRAEALSGRPNALLLVAAKPNGQRGIQS